MLGARDAAIAAEIQNGVLRARVLQLEVGHHRLRARLRVVPPQRHPAAPGAPAPRADAPQLVRPRWPVDEPPLLDRHPGLRPAGRRPPRDDRERRRPDLRRLGADPRRRRSPSPHVLQMLRAAAARRPPHPGHRAGRERRHRRRVQRRLAVATGEFIVLLDHDDLLEPPRPRPGRPHVARGRRRDRLPLHRRGPARRPTAATSTPSTSPTGRPSGSARRTTAATCRCCARPSSTTSAGSATASTAPRTTTSSCGSPSRPGRIHHIPEVLYHWRDPAHLGRRRRARPSPTPSRRGAERCRSTATASASPPMSRPRSPPGNYRVRRRLRGEPLVSIVIPTCGSSGRVWGVERVLRHRGGALDRRAGHLPEPRVRGRGRRRHTARGRAAGPRAPRRRPPEARLVRPPVQLRREDEPRAPALRPARCCCCSTTTSR